MKIVQSRHAETWPTTSRYVPSLKRKYHALHRLLQIPTGDPNIPNKVCQAKTIKKQTIGLKADLGDGEE